MELGGGGRCLLSAERGRIGLGKVADTTVGFQFEYVAGNAPLAVAREEDCALVEGLCAGDERAYETLILRFEQPVYGLVSRLLDNPRMPRMWSRKCF